MGATLYEMKATGTDVERVFDEMVEEAIYHYGHSSYSGSIATTSLGHEIQVPKKLQKAFKNNDWETIEEYTDTLYSEKRVTNYIKRVTHYEGYTPKWMSDKETVKRQKGVRTLPKFVLTTDKTEGDTYSVREYDTLTDAKRVAKKLALELKKDIIVKQVRSNHTSIKLGVMKLESDGKQHKSQRTAKTKVYLPTYEFEFFVYAAT